MRTSSRAVLGVAGLLALGATTVPVRTEAQPAGFQASAPYVVVISAVPSELEALMREATIEGEATIAGRRHFVGTLEGHSVVMFLSGVSMVNAAAATQAVIDHFDVGAIVFSGIAGGVNPNLSVGDVAVPAQWGQHQEMVFARETSEGWELQGRAGDFENFGMMFPRGQLMQGGGPNPMERQRQFWFPVDEGLLEVARGLARDMTLQRCAASGECLSHDPKLVVGGNGVSGPTFLDNAEFREWIWRVFEADAVDMETAAIAQVAALNEVPFLGFRSLSDLAGGGGGANEIRVFGRLAANNSATVLTEFLRAWPGLQ